MRILTLLVLVIIFCAFGLALVQGAVIPSENILQGPSTKITIKGPDGSIITAFAPGGQIATNGHSSVVAQAAPVVSISAPTDSIISATETFDVTESTDESLNTTEDGSEPITPKDVDAKDHGPGEALQDEALKSHDIPDRSEHDYSEQFYDDESSNVDFF